ncbi:MAG TPA: phage tail tape measure protein [Phycisphaerae bacterium]|nr:phage tail tape measure protein [Phycisphaerae bacterium]
MADLKAKVTFLADTKGLLKGVDAVEGRFNKLGSTLERHSAKLMGAGLAIGAGLAVAVKTAGDFDQSLRNMASVAKPTEAEFKAIHDMALKLGRESIHGPRKLAEVTYTLASAGMNAAKQMKVLPGIATLAAATQADLGQATQLTVGALNAFGYEASQTDRVINAFAATIGMSQANMDRLQDSLKDVAPVAGQFGQEIEDILVPLAALYDANIQASTGGVALKNILLELDNPAKALQDLLDKLQLTEADVSSQTHTVVEAFDVLKRAGATTSDMMAAFGKESAAVAAVLFGQTTAALDKNREAITGTKSAYEMAKLQAEGFGQTLALSKAALEGAGIAIGEVLLPSVKDMAIYVATAAIAISDLPPWLLDTGVKAAGATAGVFMFGSALGWVHKHTKGLGTWLTTLADKLAYFAIGVPWGAIGAGLMSLIPAGLGGLALSTAARIETLGEAEGDWARQREGIYRRMKATEDMFDPKSAEYADSMAQLNKELMALADAYTASADYAKVAADGIEDVGEGALTAKERAEALVTSLIDGVTAAFDKVGTATDKTIDPLKLADMQFAKLLGTLDNLTSLEKYDLLMASIAANSSVVAAAAEQITIPLRNINETMLALPDSAVTLGERFLAAGAMSADAWGDTLAMLTDVEGMLSVGLPGAGDAVVGAFAKTYGSLGKLSKVTWDTMKKAMAGGMKAILDQFIDMTLGKMLATKIADIAMLGMGAFLNPANLGYMAVVGSIYGAAKAAISGINSFDESAVFKRGGQVTGNMSIGDTIIAPDAMKNLMKGNMGGKTVNVTANFYGSYGGSQASARSDIDYLVERIELAMES